MMDAIPGGFAPVSDNMTALGGGAADARTRHAADAFETMAIGEMLQPIFEPLGEADGMFGGGSAERMFRPMLVEEIAKSVQRSGGLGLSDAIYRQMLQAQERER